MTKAQLTKAQPGAQPGAHPVGAQPEPSMEEILASIRRIISEDEEEQPDIDRAPLNALASAHEHANARESVREAIGGESENLINNDAEDNALTRMLDVAESSNHSTERAVEQVEPESAPPVSMIEDDQAEHELVTKDVKMIKQQAAILPDTDSSIVDTHTAEATAAAFGTLSRSVRVADDQGQTLEVLVTRMLRPMVKDWLDTNLTRIVEEKVEDEVQRLSRRG